MPNTDPAQGLFSGVQTTSPKSNRLPYVQNWNFTIQYQLPREFVLETAYIGNKGTRLRHSYWDTYNALPATFLTLGDILNDRVGAHPHLKPYPSFPDDQSVAQALRPYPQYTDVTEAYPYFANSFYNSLQVTLTRRFSNGLGVLAVYTWSKAITYDDNALQIDWTAGTQDYYNRGLERSTASYSIPHVFRLTWLYELPFGRGKPWAANNALDYLIGGWTFSAIQEYRSGGAIHVSQSGLRTPAGFGEIRPDVISPNQKLTGAPEKLDFFVSTPYLNRNAFAESPRTPDGVPLRVGTAPRYLPNIRGPHVSSESFRMSKSFPLYETLEFEFGFVAINPFNRHGRGVVTTDISSSEFGMLRVSGGGQRVIQLEGRLTW